MAIKTKRHTSGFSLSSMGNYFPNVVTLSRAPWEGAETFPDDRIDSLPDPRSNIRLSDGSEAARRVRDYTKEARRAGAFR